MNGFRTDRILPYRNGIWYEMGFAIPNFGDNTETLNHTIHRLVNVMGRNLQAIMLHTDARLRVPPTINTVIRIKKLCERARSILAGRAVKEHEPLMEAVHATPSPEEFMIYPTPYFKVANSWMREYAGYALYAISEACQHTDNSREFEITEPFARLIGQYFARIYRLLAIELLNIPEQEVEQPDFTISDEHLQSYAPSKVFTSTELIDTPAVESIPTEDDLRVLTDGIKATDLVGMINALPVRTASAQPAEAAASGPQFPPPPEP